MSMAWMMMVVSQCILIPKLKLCTLNMCSSLQINFTLMVFGGSEGETQCSDLKHTHNHFIISLGGFCESAMQEGFSSMLLRS